MGTITIDLCDTGTDCLAECCDEDNQCAPPILCNEECPLPASVLITISGVEAPGTAESCDNYIITPYDGLNEDCGGDPFYNDVECHFDNINGSYTLDYVGEPNPGQYLYECHVGTFGNAGDRGILVRTAHDGDRQQKTYLVSLHVLLTCNACLIDEEIEVYKWMPLAPSYFYNRNQVYDECEGKFLKLGPGTDPEDYSGGNFTIPSMGYPECVPGCASESSNLGAVGGNCGIEAWCDEIVEPDENGDITLAIT